MKQPTGQCCKECPFVRTSLPGYLGETTPEEFTNTAKSGMVPMPCHMAVDYDNDEEDWQEQLGSVPQCSGHAIFLSNICNLPRDPTSVFRLPANHALVFSTANEFFLYHGGNKCQNIKKTKKERRRRTTS